MIEPALDEEIVERVNELGTTSWTSVTYRHTSLRREPLSGAGARLLGGRWNPRGLFPTIYLATPASTALRELEHAAIMAAMTVEDMLVVGRELHTVQVNDLPVLDLRDPRRLASVGLGPEDISDEDRSACQAIGHAAWFLEFGGVLARSARHDDGLVLAAFETRVRPGQLQLTKTVQLDQGLYDAIRQNRDL